ncbi:hypothetical protein ACLOJK_004267 [Asimina triloba]
MDGSCLNLGAVVFAISWVWRKMLDFEWSKWDADGSGPSANGVWSWTLNDMGACCRRQLMTDGAGGCCLFWIGRAASRRKAGWRHPWGWVELLGHGQDAIWGKSSHARIFVAAWNVAC